MELNFFQGITSCSFVIYILYELSFWSNNISDIVINESDTYSPSGLTDLSTSELSELDSSFEENFENINDSSSSD